MIEALSLTIPVLALVILVPPLFRRSEEAWNVPEKRIETLEEKKRQLLTAIRELDFDFRTGKLGDPDYGEARAAMKEELKEVVLLLKGETGVHG
jgi:hypothetical protein